jgi:NOL1/NOP2/fmu family ribosome biogenesis protein
VGDSEAVVAKTAKNDKKKKSSPEKRDNAEAELLAAASDFLKENLRIGFENGTAYTLVALGGKAYLKPDIDLPKYGVFAAGVCVGEMIGKRFVPHHQLFSAFGRDFLRRIILTETDKETYDYLRGMEIGVDGRLEAEGKREGYAAVLVNGSPLGGGKISGGVCKNHYPKGLRNQQ